MAASVSTASVYKLSGSYSTQPAQGAPSGKASESALLNEVVYLSVKTTNEILLSDATPVDVPFGGVDEAAVVFLKSVGGPVEVKLTTSLGVDQVIPIDGMLQLISVSNPVQSITLTRTSSVNTLVNVFLGEKA